MMVRTKNKVLQAAGASKNTTRQPLPTGTTALPSCIIAAKHVVVPVAMAWESVKSKPPSIDRCARPWFFARPGGCKSHMMI